MPLLINNQIVNSEKMLSRKAGLIINFIPAASYWLEGVIRAKNNTIFSAEDELITHALYGLHNTRLIYLPWLKLWISPKKLMETSQEDLSVVVSSSAVEASLQVYFLNKYSWVNDSCFAPLYVFFKKHDLINNALFANVSFSEKMDVLPIINAIDKHDIPQGLSGELVLLALIKSLSIRDFFNIYLFYFQCFVKIKLDHNDKKSLSEVLESVYLIFLRAVAPFLNLPTSVRPLTQVELSQLLRNWISQGNFFGFLDVGSAIRIMAEQILFSDASAVSITEAINEFMVKVNAFFNSHLATDAELTQLGDAWIYYFDYADVSAKLFLQPRGFLSINSFHVH